MKVDSVVRAVENSLHPVHHLKGSQLQVMTLKDRMAYHNVPGFSIALINQDQIAWVQGYGLMEAGGDKPVTAETIFQAASISKPVTAVIALRLVEDGMLDLDSDVNDALRSWKVPENEFTRDRKVTLRGLLSHTAGVSVFGYRGYPVGEKLPTMTQILQGEPPANSDPVEVFQAPGQGFSYSGGGYVLIQQLIEDVTGRTLAEHARELVFEPLGMVHSTFEHLLPEDYYPQTAIAHLWNGKPVPGKWHTYPEGAPASLWSTPTDLAKFTLEVLRSYWGESSRILSPEMTRQMLTPQFGFIGLGIVIVEKDGWTRIEHPGWNEGYHSYLAGFLEAGQGMIWMTNGENGKLLGLEVTRGLAEVFGWPGFQPVEKTIFEIDPAVFSQYTGVYRDVEYPEFGAEIICEGNELYFCETPGNLKYQIYPGSETEFFSIHNPDTIKFVAREGNPAESMQIGPFVRLSREE